MHNSYADSRVTGGTIQNCRSHFDRYLSSNCEIYSCLCRSKCIRMMMIWWRRRNVLIEFKTIGVLRYPDTDTVVYPRHTRINGMRLNDVNTQCQKLRLLRNDVDGADDIKWNGMFNTIYRRQWRRRKFNRCVSCVIEMTLLSLAVFLSSCFHCSQASHAACCCCGNSMEAFDELYRMGASEVRRDYNYLASQRANNNIKRTLSVDDEWIFSVLSHELTSCTAHTPRNTHPHTDMWDDTFIWVSYQPIDVSARLCAFITHVEKYGDRMIK